MTIRLHTRLYFFFAFLITHSAGACGIPSEAQNSSLSDLAVYQINDSTAWFLDELYKTEEGIGHLSGSVLVLQKDTMLYREAFGSKQLTVPNTVDTRFDIGSISKQFTAAAILKLVEKGQFQLNDKINPHLGPLASKYWDKVTIHHLLTHTSGIPSIYQTGQGIDIFMPQAHQTDIQSLIQKFSNTKTLFQPGEEFAYSNSGYLLLAAIIEQNSGRDFASYMQEEIFEKHGLNNTSFRADENSAQPMFGYRDDLLSLAPSIHYSWMIGSGGVFSNTRDLAKWTQVIRSDTFLGEPLRSQYLTGHTSQGYGYGWVVEKSGKFYHDGGNTGFMSFLSVDPTADIVVVLLTNRSHREIHDYGKSAAYVSDLVAKTWRILEGERNLALPSLTAHAERDMNFQLPNNIRGEIKRLDETTLRVKAADIQASRMMANCPLDPHIEENKSLVAIASCLLNKKYWAVSKWCTSEMRFVCYSGLMRKGMNYMRKQTGDIHEMVPFLLEETYGLINAKGEKGNLVLIVYFNESGRVQGIFEHGFTLPDQEVAMRAYSIGDSRYYLDGLPYAEPSSYFELTPEGMILECENRRVNASVMPSR